MESNRSMASQLLLLRLVVQQGTSLKQMQPWLTMLKGQHYLLALN